MFPRFVRFVAAVLLLATPVGAAAKSKKSLRTAQTTVAPKPQDSQIAQTIYDKGLQGGWQDWGWTQRSLEAGKPARLHMNNYGGWILAHRNLTGQFSALSFNIKGAGQLGEFLEVHLASDGDDSLPRVMVGAAHRHPLEGGWVQVQIKMSELNPSASPFDRITFRAAKAVADGALDFDKIVLYGGVEQEAKVDVNSMRSHSAALQVDCRAPSHAISPMIYGIAFNPRRVGADPYQWDMGVTSRRWGGNPASRYNWQLGNAWNTALDWFFMNVNYTNDGSYSWKKFLDDDRDHHVSTALTVPIMGWIAKDTDSYSYSVSEFGPQQYANGDVGNGKRSNGGPISGADPHRTSIEGTPQFTGDWVKAIRAYDNDTHTRNVHEYILDNEPALWNSTHRDVHPQALTYDELLKRTIDYGTAVRQADPQATIAGPAEWGWPAYFFSAKDAEAGFNVKPDRRAHGDEPLLDWYLRKLREHARSSGTRVLDVLDLHYYPQADGIYGQNEKTDPASAERRLRAVRSLWDPSYKDESWINEKIQLLPRMRDLIAANYPGLKMSIGEYNFGGERHISGGLAQAWALGLFGQYDVYSAYYWTYPPSNSCTYNAFKAFRNYDGQGAHFLERSVQAAGDAKTPIFVSQNESRDTMVAIVLNLDPHDVANAKVTLGGCGNYRVNRAFYYTGGPSIKPWEGKVEVTGGAINAKLLPYSINVFELKAQ